MAFMSHPLPKVPTFCEGRFVSLARPRPQSHKKRHLSCLFASAGLIFWTNLRNLALVEPRRIAAYLSTAKKLIHGRVPCETFWPL